MRVIAKRLGHAGVLRQPGEVFEMPDNAKGTWFDPVPEAKPAEAPAEPVPEVRPKGRKDLA